MKSAICTLFEGNYHLGLGALANSLHYHGFRSVIWAGYRGDLPPWSTQLVQHEKYLEYQYGEGCSIRFIKLETDSHLTNYKPDFILKLWEEYCPSVDALFYFDPDITITHRWSYYEEWITYGIALCEDISSPIPDSHPRRMAWRKYYGEYGLILKPVTDMYINGGFIGLKHENREFLYDWSEAQKLMAKTIGGLSKANLRPTSESIFNKFFMFDKTDQDALNVAIMYSRAPISLMAKGAMGFSPGGDIMLHALGHIKPWLKDFTLSALKGKSPSWADRSYWQHTQNPIQLYSPIKFFLKKLDLLSGKVIARVIG